ncbi:carbon storage regulator, CsrA [Sulfobacillus acidophilus DSM 10332]|uniref:Translational regulator CsrA n=1 Tax=Sulfobacillus acidophilus (strain ATCC 700253 / DSM 10332 / NAL) TaxID=679936 RepID=G8U1G7_SULAD|nr:carbon storage regulator, CsrA [Sulfobacillus acidophilus DSM 10332]
MLVLARKVNEAVLLMDGTVRIVVLGVQGDQVKLGIEAPRSIAIMREEIFEAQSENQRAAQSVLPEGLGEISEIPPSPQSLPPKPKSP